MLIALSFTLVVANWTALWAASPVVASPIHAAPFLAWHTTASRIVGPPFAARLARSDSASHPIHLSSTQVELSRDKKSLEITVRIFTDDFERAISPVPARPIQISKTNAATVDSLITSYFAPRVLFGVNGGLMTNARILGHKIDGDATVVSATMPISATLKRLSVEQRVMLEQFDDQSNVVRVTVGAKRQSALTRRGVERAELTF